jgi:hypothetical protein
MTCCEPTGRVWAESDVSILWKDCWSSSALGFLHPLLAHTEARRVSEMRENLDLSVPAGRLMFQIIGAMAEFERERASSL